MRIASLVCCFLCLHLPTAAQAEFIISSAIIEFSAATDTQKDIELISRSETSDYINTRLFEIIAPGTPAQERRPVDDPAQAGLLVTPQKTILPGGGRKVLRFVLLEPPSDKERIYRVDIEPTIKGIKSEAAAGLKVLVGYEALIIIRPSTIQPAANIQRQGKQLHIHNRGNSNLLLESGLQCPKGIDFPTKNNPANENSPCSLLPATRIYAGGETTIDLPFDAPLFYSVWDGVAVTEKHFD